MKPFSITAMSDSSILALNDIREKIDVAPDYQRPGGVWSPSKKKLFIDSLLNGYDIPKVYLHTLIGEHEKDGYEYSIIDGRQRMETIWEFLDNRFPLATDFKYFENDDVQAGGMLFSDLEENYPRLAVRLHSRTLAVTLITTDDLDYIEDMFSRLNEAVPLSAAEKRNAFGGPLPKIIRDLSKHTFFKEKVAFPASRYRHYDVASKFLVQENAEGIVDTKKARLDDFVKSRKESEAAEFNELVKSTEVVLDELAGIFGDKDALLKSSGLVVVFYVLLSKGLSDNLSRQSLLEFDELRKQNRQNFEADDDELPVNFEWIEYDELAQSANDGAAIKQRAEILAKFLNSK